MAKKNKKQAFEDRVKQFNKAKSKSSETPIKGVFPIEDYIANETIVMRIPDAMARSFHNNLSFGERSAVYSLIVCWRYMLNEEKTNDYLMEYAFSTAADIETAVEWVSSNRSEIQIGVPNTAADAPAA